MNKFQVGGYSLPFSTMGALLLLSAFATYYILPELPSTQEKVTTSGLETFYLLKHPSIFITAYSIVATTAGVGFLHSTLEPQIDVIQVSKVARPCKGFVKVDDILNIFIFLNSLV